jgi:predicted N-acyltransferase
VHIQHISAINQVDKADWNGLVGSPYPFLRHEFLSALEESGSVSAKTGWQPRHLLVKDKNRLIAAMPLYLKTHSWGEYVFDQQWSYAYQQAGGNYYPKWLTAIPFTPCQGMRFAIAESVEHKAVVELLLAYIKEQSERKAISSWHCLFPDAGQLELLRELGLLIREGVQFQWFNKGYRDFEDFLDTFTSAKRKMVKRERRKVAEQDIEFIRLAGNEANADLWRLFFDLYQATYLKKGSPPYLNLDFFLTCAERIGEDMLLVFARKNGAYVGAALSFIGGGTLYGRYWGCLAEYDFLHFETCYYQGLDYCLAHGLHRFDSGAQGEHKIARGFEPVTTFSAHWFADAGFGQLIERFLSREKIAMQFYRQDAASYLPFKK